MIYAKKYNSPIGEITIATDGDELVGLWFDNQKHFGGKYKNKIEYINKNLKIFDDVILWLDKYFGGIKSKINFQLILEGSEFQNKVWKKLIEIPYATTVTYRDIAKSMGVDRGYCQAIGGAVGKNPISIIIPCHRVIGSDGTLKGYAAGIEKKEYLLKLERSHLVD